MPGDAIPKVEVADRGAWRAWLAQNHGASGSIWLVYPRKRTAGPWMSNDDIVEEAICFGWIDSLPRRLDEARSMLLLSPRKAGSNWSAVNKGRAERMIAAGLMRPAGLAAIEAAKASGTWSALDGVEALVIPDDLQAAFEAAGPEAAENFGAFPRSAKRGILEWILNARKAETRAARVLQTASLARENRRANQWRGPAAGA